MAKWEEMIGLCAAWNSHALVLQWECAGWALLSR